MTAKIKAALNEKIEAAFKEVQHSDFKPVRALAQRTARYCDLCFRQLRPASGYPVHGRLICATCHAWHTLGMTLESWRSREARS